MENIDKSYLVSNGVRMLLIALGRQTLIGAETCQVFGLKFRVGILVRIYLKDFEV